MRPWIALAVTCPIALLSLASGLEGSGPGRSSGRNPVVVPTHALKLGCGLQEGSGSSRSDPRFREKSVVIGPVALFPAGSEYPRLPIEPLGEGLFAPTELLVALTRGDISPGEATTVRLVGTARRHAAFFSSRIPVKPEGYRVSEGVPALVARACEAGPGFRLYTTYNVGLLVDSARCLPLIVSVKGRRVARGVVRFGIQECGQADAPVPRSGAGSPATNLPR